MAHETDERSCAWCGCRTLFSRATPNWPLHVVLAFLTGGGWVIVMIVLLLASPAPWRCGKCGRLYGTRPPSPAELQAMQQREVAAALRREMRAAALMAAIQSVGRAAAALMAAIRSVGRAAAAPVRRAWAGAVETYGVGHAAVLTVLAVLAMGGVVIALIYWVRVLLRAGSL